MNRFSVVNIQDHELPSAQPQSVPNIWFLLRNISTQDNEVINLTRKAQFESDNFGFL